MKRASIILALLAAAVWLGGLLALGAIAAPVVFSVVPAPTSADAMTLVFQRFDRVAMTCSALVLIAEGGLALSARGARFRAIDVARIASGALAAALAVVEGAIVSPKIAALHASGAIRGLGPAGLELARAHDLAERCGQGQLILLTTLIVLHVVSLSP
jgi:hypothetical protein